MLYISIIIFLGWVLMYLFCSISLGKISKDMEKIYDLKEKCEEEAEGIVVAIRREIDSQVKIKSSKMKSFRGYVTVEFYDKNKSKLELEYPYFFVDENIPNVGDKIRVFYNKLNSKEFILPSQHTTKFVLENKSRKWIKRFKKSSIFLIAYVIFVIIVFVID